MKLKFTAIAILSLIALSACNNGTRDWQKFQKKYASDGVSFRLNGLMKWVASGIISKAQSQQLSIAH